MSQMRTDFEDELELEGEDEFEDEAFLGGLAKIAGSLLGEGEDEDEGEQEAEDELEGEYEQEFESKLQGEFEGEFESEFEGEDEAFLGGLARMAGSLLGEGEDEDELESEDEDEAEEFFKRAWRTLRRHAPMFKKLAKIVGPMVATAVGGPAAGALARVVTSQLEGELEDELESELEDMATAPVTPTQALSEYLAAKAATAASESEAEAFAGSAVTLALSGYERRELEALLPRLMRGAAILTRALYRNRGTRAGIRLVPGIVTSAANTVVRRGGGSPADLGRVLAGTTQRVLDGGRWQQSVVRRHARGLSSIHRRRHGRIGLSYADFRRGGYRGPSVIRRQPVRTRTLPIEARVPRPPRGMVRVVTPVRIPARNGRPARTIRVVSDVRVPRGARPVGRPVPVTARRR
jgi:hypothetical protein